MATIRQQKTIAHIQAGDSVSKAMAKAGYKHGYAKNPQQLTRTKSFIEILEKAGISDEKLSERLNEGLDATKAVVMGKESSDSFVDVQPDYAIRHKYIETSLKLKGHSLDKPNTTNIVIPILGGLSVVPVEEIDVLTNNSNVQTSQVTQED